MDVGRKAFSIDNSVSDDTGLTESKPPHLRKSCAVLLDTSGTLVYIDCEIRLLAKNVL